MPSKEGESPVIAFIHILVMSLVLLLPIALVALLVYYFLHTRKR